jgi:hypothetical protein
MREIISSLSMLLVALSAIAFFVSIVMVIFDTKNRKLSLRILLFSIIAFVIGFGTCVASFSMGSMN